MTRALGVTVLVAAAVLVAAGYAAVSAPAAGRASITKIVFSGTTASPAITVIGRNLTRGAPHPPAASPSYTPGGHPGCPKNFPGPQGHDYGTRFYLADTSANPQWAGGRYRPSLGELDCIGLLVDRWSSGTIRFHLGSFYRLGHFGLNTGDTVEIVVNHLTVGVTVKYGPAGVQP